MAAHGEVNQHLGQIDYEPDREVGAGTERRVRDRLSSALLVGEQRRGLGGQRVGRGDRSD